MTFLNQKTLIGYDIENIQLYKCDKLFVIFTLARWDGDGNNEKIICKSFNILRWLLFIYLKQWEMQIIYSFCSWHIFFSLRSNRAMSRFWHCRYELKLGAQFFFGLQKYHIRSTHPEKTDIMYIFSRFHYPIVLFVGRGFGLSGQRVGEAGIRIDGLGLNLERYE